jgi:hypothetical protein
VEGYFCETEKTRGFICKSARLRIRGWIGSVGSRSSGSDLKRARTGVDRYVAGLTGGVARSEASGCHRTALVLRERAAAASGRRRGKAWRRAAASGGAEAKRRWGAPFSAGTAPRRRARAGELDRGTTGRRRRGTAAPGEPRRRHQTGDGEGGGAAHGNPSGQRRGAPHLEAKLRDGSNSTARRRRRGLEAAARTEEAAARSARVRARRTGARGFRVRRGTGVAAQ